MPARDEAGRVGECVAALLAQDAAVAEVVVVDDGSADGTAAEAARAGARVEAAPAPRPGVAGKAAACAHGARVATAGRWLAFVDADVIARPRGPVAAAGGLPGRRGGGGQPAGQAGDPDLVGGAAPARPGPGRGRAARPRRGRRPGPPGGLPVRAVPAGQAGRLRGRWRVRGRGRVTGRGRRPGRPAQGGRPPPRGPPGPRPGRRAHVRALRRPVGGAGQEPGRGLGGRDGPAGLAGGPDGRRMRALAGAGRPARARRPGGSPWPAACSS